MQTRLLLPFALALSLHAQPDRMDLLRQVRDRVRDSIHRMPKYMCTQTIDRQQFELVKAATSNCDHVPAPKDLRLSTSDRLRFDVGVTGAGEIYTWAGAKRFDDRSLFDLVHEGSISNGIFAAFLMAIFQDDEAAFSYLGDTTDGPPVAEFKFRMALEKSHYIFIGNAGKVTTAYEGEIFVDPNTADLVRMIVRTVGLPPETGSCQASAILDYGRVHLEGGDFLLPTQANSEVRNVSGSKSENHTVFANCHEFLGESTISFDLPPDQAAGAAAATPTRPPPTLPPGIRFTVTTTQDVNIATAAAGDLIQLKLSSAIRSASNEVLAPAGSAVTARLVRIRQYFGATSTVSMGLKLETIELNGVAMALTARPNFPLRVFTVRVGKPPRKEELGGLSNLDDRDAVDLVFRSGERQSVISRGLESSWITIDSNDPEPAIHNLLAPGKRQ